MTKKSKKRSLTTSSSSSSSSNTKWSDLPWNKISTHEEIQEESFYTSKNHYDNPKASIKDLYDPSSSNKSIDFVQGANDPGVFLNLEVIDGSQYDIEKVLVKNDVSGVVEGYVSRLVVKNSDGDSNGNEKKESSSNKTSDDNKKKKKKDLKQKQETPSTDTTTTTTPPPPAAETKMTRKERNKLKLKQMKEKRKLEKQKRKLEKQEQESSTTPQQPKKKHKKAQPTVQQTIIQVSQQDMESIRVPWSIATGGVYLHPKLCTSLFRLGFTSPTPIQSSTLAASILGQRDIVGAAPTGSVRFY